MRSPPERVEVVPGMAAAALLSRAEVGYWTWALLREAARSGGGHLARTDAVALQMATRGVTSRRAEQVLAEGAGLLWNRSPDRLFLCGAHRVAAGLGADYLGVPQRVRVAGVRTAVDIRAALYAVQSPPRRASVGVRRVPLGASGEHVLLPFERFRPLGRAPMTRALVERLTGLSPRQQRAYDRMGATKLLGPTYAHVSGSAGEPFARHGPFVRTPDGELLRRFGDRRESPHEPGSKAALRHLRRSLARALGKVDLGSRGAEGTASRVWFHGRTRDEALEKAHTARARFAVLVYGKSGRIRREVVEDVRLAWRIRNVQQDGTPRRRKI